MNRDTDIILIVTIKHILILEIKLNDVSKGESIVYHGYMNKVCKHRTILRREGVVSALPDGLTAD